MSKVTDLSWQWTSRHITVPPVGNLPEGRMVSLGSRGETYVTDTGAPHARPDAPTLFLLHALACTGALTWYPHIDALSERYRVITLDQRWHGQGIRSPRFRLEDCADDVAAVADAVQVDRFMVAGYSMGSLVSQLAWRRHPDRVSGAVLCASTPAFTRREHVPQTMRTVSHRVTRAVANRSNHSVPARPASAAMDPDGRWALEQFRRTTPAEITGAGAVISTFDSRRWIGEMNVPAAVVVTSRDKLLPPSRQRWLARQIHGATIYEADAGHSACVLRADVFRPALLAACASVASRTAARGRQ